jgi:uncharacterized surface protein with fasciclin (FAS1) repeats
MRNFAKNIPFRFIRYIPVLALVISSLVSCSDPYLYDNQEPEWLGANIYTYLQEQGVYTQTLKLIDDLKYTEDMQLAGSLTLFVVKDSAYDIFFQNNEWGVHSYEDLSLAQKKLLLNFSIINNAYLLQTIVDYYDGSVTNEGSAMRRFTKLSAMDSIAFDKGDLLPESPYWKNWVNKGLHVMKDDTDTPTLFYTQDFLNMNSITNEDFRIFSGGKTRTNGDVHIFNDKVIIPNIVCKNGYIHVLDHVLTVPKNMAQYLESNDSTKIFSKLLDRFCAPYYDSKLTSTYNELEGREPIDSIFVKHYFSLSGGAYYYPDGTGITNMLPYDPGWNGYPGYPDMAAMFVPSDKAMYDYFNSGLGDILRKRFGTWEDVPDNIILPFLKRHMRTSFIESVPSRFGKMVDAGNYRLPVETDHIENAYTGVNGEVYITNKVYPPVDYISVYSPVLLSANTNIFNWAINRIETSTDGTAFQFYKLYLNSLVSKYSFFVPTDEYFSDYFDPIAWGQEGTQGALKFYYNKKTSAVNAIVKRYNKTTGVMSDSIGNISDESFIQDRLWNILDSHVVVDTLKGNNNSNYYVTKGNDLIRVEGSGLSMKVSGGFDMDQNTPSHVTTVFPQENGTTYFLDKPIQPSMKSVFQILSETEAFKPFFALLNGVPDTCVNQIFTQQGVDYRINFFNAYRYTIYVPTDTAIQSAFDRHLITPWDTIYAMTNKATQTNEIQKMIRFLRYHFQDDAVFFGQHVNKLYQSATINNNGTTPIFKTGRNKYYKIGVNGDDQSLTLTTELNNKVHVVTTNDLYNIVAKDFIFSLLPSKFKNIDGTGSATGSNFFTSRITTSASAVIHQIDNVLTFQ